MMTAISVAVAAIMETRNRRLATLCVFAAWVTLIVALATDPSDVLQNPFAYTFGIGTAVGMFTGQLWRDSSEGMRHAFTIASLHAGSFAVAFIAAVLVALVLHPVLRIDGLDAMIPFWLCGFTLLVLGGWRWDRGQRG